MKRIKKQLNTTSTKLIDRKARQKQLTVPNAPNMLKFIKDSLKPSDSRNNATTYEKDPIKRSLAQTLYSNANQKRSCKLINKKITGKQLSKALVTNYNFKQ